MMKKRKRTAWAHEYWKIYRSRPDVKARRAEHGRRYRFSKKLKDAGIAPEIVAREVALFLERQAGVSA
jgi:hypothetical protein